MSQSSSENTTNTDAGESAKTSSECCSNCDTCSDTRTDYFSNVTADQLNSDMHFQEDRLKVDTIPDNKVIVSVPCSLHSKKPPLSGKFVFARLSFKTCSTKV